MIDEAFRKLAEDRRATVRRPPEGIPVAKIRAAADAFLKSVPAGPEMADVEDVDPAPVSLRRYRPHDAIKGRLTLFIHGGGFVWGSLDTHDAMARSIADAGRCELLSVDYRLAPEHGWNDAAQDCRAALVHACRMTSNPISLIGDSAGGQLALATALFARDENIPTRSLGLFYPLLDPECAFPSALAYAEGPILSLEGMRWFWECASAQVPPPRLLEANLTGLPPTTVVVGGADPLRDEGIALSVHLQRCGVKTTLHDMPGMVHGFAGMPHLTSTAEIAIRLLAGSLFRD